MLQSSQHVNILQDLTSFYIFNPYTIQSTLFLPYLQNIHAFYFWFNTLKTELNVHYTYQDFVPHREEYSDTEFIGWSL